MVAEATTAGSINQVHQRVRMRSRVGARDDRKKRLRPVWRSPMGLCGGMCCYSVNSPSRRMSFEAAPIITLKSPGSTTCFSSML